MASESNTETSIENVSISTAGSIYINGNEATNEKLSEYFNYTNYENSQDKNYVEGIFNSKTITINGTKYNATLNENGEMESVDGNTTLSQEQIQEYFGNKGYEALVCKSTKNVTIVNDEVVISDKEDKSTINLENSYTNSNDTIEENTESKNTNAENNKTEATNETNSSTKTGNETLSASTASSVAASTGSSISSGASSSKSSSPTSSIEESNPYNFSTTTGGNSIIKVDLDQLSSIKDELSSLSGKLNEVGEDYTDTINAINNSNAWAGSDKDTYISQKTGYTSNMSDIYNTLNSFVTYLEECISDYQTIESQNASKTIS